MLIGEVHELESGQIVATHPLNADCWFAWCPFHNPSNWALKRSPRIMSPCGRMFRVCVHGTGHPDIDDPGPLPGCLCGCGCCGLAR